MQSVLIRIRPSCEEQKEALETLKGLMPKLKGLDIVIGGSFAKKTQLCGNYDIDLFARFEKGSTNIPDLTEKLLKKRKIKYRRVHGSRDYFEIQAGKYNVELIPIIKISEAKESENITDISPLHTKWVNQNINNKLADEVRLLKAFCIANGCYGAESYIQGLSGYVCEIIIAHFGSFKKTLQAAVKWKDKTIIDIARHHKGRIIQTAINAAKMQGPLIVVDPVQKERNAAAAVSDKTMKKFQTAAAAYIKAPSEKFFMKQSIKIKRSQKHATIVLKALPLPGKTDIMNSKIVKAAKYIEQQLQENGFEVYNTSIEWNEWATIVIETQKKLPKQKTIKGPPVRMQSHAEMFAAAHKETRTAKGIIYAHETREYTDPKSLVADLISHPYVKERTAVISLD